MISSEDTHCYEARPPVKSALKSGASDNILYSTNSEGCQQHALFSRCSHSCLSSVIDEESTWLDFART